MVNFLCHTHKYYLKLPTCYIFCSGIYDTRKGQRELTICPEVVTDIICLNGTIHIISAIYGQPYRACDLPEHPITCQAHWYDWLNKITSICQAKQSCILKVKGGKTSTCSFSSFLHVKYACEFRKTVHTLSLQNSDVTIVSPRPRIIRTSPMVYNSSILFFSKNVTKATSPEEQLGNGSLYGPTSYHKQNNISELVVSSYNNFSKLNEVNSIASLVTRSFKSETFSFVTSLEYSSKPTTEGHKSSVVQGVTYIENVFTTDESNVTENGEPPTGSAQGKRGGVNKYQTFGVLWGSSEIIKSKFWKTDIPSNIGQI